jgi:hypothetical protein
MRVYAHVQTTLYTRLPSAFINVNIRDEVHRLGEITKTRHVDHSTFRSIAYVRA